MDKGNRVIGLDNLSTGKQENIDSLSIQGKERFEFIKGDICKADDINRCFNTKIDVVVHLAAQVSVQKSFVDIKYNNRQNIDGFTNVLTAAGQHQVREFIYASSCSIYGDSEILPITEKHAPNPLSPYAASKLMNEILGRNLSHIFSETRIIGLRLFNLFGPWQDPLGDYAAVIPKWIDLCIEGSRPIIYGDGNATRDFCYVGNVCGLIMNLVDEKIAKVGGIYNVASGVSTSLNNLYGCIVNSLHSRGIDLSFDNPIYKPWREGDIVHSLGSIDLACSQLNFKPKISLDKGIDHILTLQYGL